MSPNQAISRSLRLLQSQMGGKAVCCHFDGRGGSEVAETTVSRWIHRPETFDPDNLPTLIRLEPSLGRYFLQMTPIWMGLPEAVLRELPPETQTRVRQAFEKLILAETGPGRGVR